MKLKKIVCNNPLLKCRCLGLTMNLSTLTESCYNFAQIMLNLQELSLKLCEIGSRAELRRLACYLGQHPVIKTVSVQGAITPQQYAILIEEYSSLFGQKKLIFEEMM
jgi:hypothetical protein